MAACDWEAPMAEQCLNCLAMAHILESRVCSNGSRRRRFMCQNCGERWTSHQGDPPGHRGGMPAGRRLQSRRLTPDEVRLVLESSTSSVALARELGCSHTAVIAIRVGRTYSHLHPDIPRRAAGLSCLKCTRWSDSRCTMGLPDPEEEGPTFAAYCSLYLPK